MVRLVEKREGIGMKRLEKFAVVVIALLIVVCLIGVYSTWSKCKAEGGITVRGLFGLECIK